MRSFVVIISLVIVCAIIFFWTSDWTSSTLPTSPVIVVTSTEDILETQIQVEGLLASKKPGEAIKIIRQFEDDIENQTESGKKWLSLFIEASVQLKDASQLVILYEYYPTAFDNHEDAALIVADTYIKNRKVSDYQDLHRRWHSKTKEPASWFVFDIDQLLLEGKRHEAIKRLQSHSFDGPEDTGRLVRLALLTSKETPKLAWKYLTDAYKSSPNNPDIRSYRAQLLETVGKRDLALAEYIAATQTAPHNIFFQDQLAEYYIREKDYSNAIDVWISSLDPPSADFIWVKALFWDHVTTPSHHPWNNSLTPSGKERPLIEYLIHMEPGTFWSQAQFDQIPNSQEFLIKEQATFWLRLVNALQNGNESVAWNLLQYNPFTASSWNPELETALKRILTYRKSDNLSLGLTTAPTKQLIDHDEADYPLFAQLESLAQNQSQIPSNLKALLRGPDAFAATFLSAGWFEVALALKESTFIPKEYPEWVSYGLTTALNQNRGSHEALEFATVQTPSPALSLLIGELLISEGNENAGLEELKELINDTGDVGIKARWLTSLIYIEKKTIQPSPRDNRR